MSDDLEDLHKEYEAMWKLVGNKGEKQMLAFVLHVGLSRIATAIREQTEYIGTSPDVLKTIKNSIDELTYKTERKG